MGKQTLMNPLSNLANKFQERKKVHSKIWILLGDLNLGKKVAALIVKKPEDKAGTCREGFLEHPNSTVAPNKEPKKKKVFLSRLANIMG